MASADITVTVAVELRLTFWDALKLRLAGPEIRVQMADELRLKMSQILMARVHPENDV